MSISDFLWNKWCRGFRTLDVDKNGVMTENDFGCIAEFISKKTNASPEEAKITRQAWAGWFPCLRPDPSVDELDVYEHNNGLARLYLKDTEAFKNAVSHTFSDLFDNLDLNKDGYISLEELEVFYQALGVTDKQFAKEVFQLIDTDGNAMIERGEWVRALVQYWTNPEQPDDFEFIFDPSYGKHPPRGLRQGVMNTGSD